MKIHHFRIIIFFALFFSISAMADTTQKPIAAAEVTPVQSSALGTLASLISQKTVLDEDIATLNAEIKKALSDSEKEQLKIDLDSTVQDAKTISRSIENLAASTDISSLRATKKEEFNFQKEFLSLLEPTLKEVRHLTDDVRVKSDLRDRIEFVNKRIPVVKTALANVNKLDSNSDNRKLNQHLQKLKIRWQQKLQGYETELSSATLQLEKFVENERIREENEPGYLKTFFKKRGWVLLKAAGAILLVLFISSLIRKLLARTIVGYQRENRSVRLRIIDLIHRAVTVIFMIIAPMFVFYTAEDWVLFTLSILLLVGAAFSLRETVPRYWKQIEIFLNIGSVREGERLLMDGLPWEVKNINLFTTLHNPRANLTKRVKLGELISLNSRPADKSEPWFPCEKGDWVILSDGTRGKVIGISLELVELIVRGGGRSTYTLDNFLSASPHNISLNFRIKEILGISYNNQQVATDEAPAMLKAYLSERLLSDGYDKILQSINVEFEKANDSSLDLVIIADFKGEAADIYNRLRRAIQRYCVDASTAFDWEIPFPQVTFHNPALT